MLNDELKIGSEVFFFPNGINDYWHVEEPKTYVLDSVTRSSNGTTTYLKNFGNVSSELVFATREAAKIARASQISTDAHKRWEHANKLRTLPLPVVATDTSWMTSPAAAQASMAAAVLSKAA